MKKNNPRANCKDVWNAFMVKGAVFSQNDIPFCPTTATNLPEKIVTYKEAKEIYRAELKKGNRNFKNKAFVCFYEDDQDFDLPSGIWFCWKYALRILNHFEGIITPDFSTYIDFPEPLRRWNTYRMRAFGYWYGKLGHQVINNVRWNDQTSFDWTFDGISKHSIVAIGTVASGLKKSENRPLFENGLVKMAEVLNPKIIIVYGSAKNPVFQDLKTKGIRVIQYKSSTATFFDSRKKKEEKEHE